LDFFSVVGATPQAGKYSVVESALHLFKSIKKPLKIATYENICGQPPLHKLLLLG
jgi:hypothetical protein